MRAPPDGYTLLLVSAAAAINATLYEKLNFDFIRDIAPVAGIIRAPNVVVVNPSFPATTLPEFIAYAKANPGKINMASPGNGTVPHLAGELFKMMTGVNIIFVPYRGDAPALTDLLGGQVQMIFRAPRFHRVHQSWQAACASRYDADSMEGLPDVPTMGEFVPGYEASPWFGVGAPKRTPPRSSRNSTRRSMLPWPTRR